MWRRGGPSEMARSVCPRCSASPRGARWRGQPYLRCDGCESGWWDRVALGRVATLVPDALEAHVASAEIDAARGTSIDGDCPACAASRMEMAVWGETPIHRCAACGTTGIAQTALVRRHRAQRREAARKVARSTARGMIFSVLGPLIDFVPIYLDRVLFPPD